MNVTLRTSAAGVWFAPAVMLLGARSPFASRAALALVVSVTRVLYSQWQLAPKPPANEEPPEALAHLHRRTCRKVSCRAISGPRSHRGGRCKSGMSVPTSKAVLAGVFYALAAGIAHRLFHRCRRLDARSATHPAALHSRRGGNGDDRGLIHRRPAPVWQRFGDGDSDGIGRHCAARGVREPAAATAETQCSAMHKAEPPPIDPARLGPAVSVPGGVPGVILWPDTEQVPLLVEPMPKGETLGAREASRPICHSVRRLLLDVPHWLFSSAGQFHCGAWHADRDFLQNRRSWPLEMEAHQRLDREIDLSCCSPIRVDVLNADQHPGTITVELAVIDRAGPRVRLGRAEIRSTPDLTQILSNQPPRRSNLTCLCTRRASTNSTSSFTATPSEWIAARAFRFNGLSWCRADSAPPPNSLNFKYVQSKSIFRCQCNIAACLHHYRAARSN